VMLAPQADLRDAPAGTGPWTWARQAARRWTVPAGLAAGVAMVSATVWLMQASQQELGAPASHFSKLGAGIQVAGAASAAPMERFRVANGLQAVGFDDAGQAVDFEPYLSAHKQFQTSTAPGPATGFLRSAVYEGR
jgi:hypothetical protein